MCSLLFTFINEHFHSNDECRREKDENQVKDDDADDDDDDGEKDVEEEEGKRARVCVCKLLCHLSDMNLCVSFEMTLSVLFAIYKRQTVNRGKKRE